MKHQCSIHQPASDSNFFVPREVQRHENCVRVNQRHIKKQNRQQKDQYTAPPWDKTNEEKPHKEQDQE